MYIKLTLFKQLYMTSFQKPCTQLKYERLITIVGQCLVYPSPDIWAGIVPISYTVQIRGGNLTLFLRKH